jgi:hypothetical protein
MKQEEITKIVNKVYPLIIQDIIIDSNCKIKNVYPEIEFHYNIYERLSGEKGMTGEVCAHAEYDWVMCKIYLYTSRLHSIEDIIRSLIHECVHSRQLKCTFDSFYENGHTYDTHPYEIEARNAEEEWKKYKKI